MKHHCKSHFGPCLFRGIFLVAGGTLAVMLLWNWLMPALFNLKEVTFLQSAGLLILGRLLFGGFRGHHGHCHQCSHDEHARLTDEERAQLRARFKEKWFGCKSASTKTENTQQQ